MNKIGQRQTAQVRGREKKNFPRSSGMSSSALNQSRGGHKRYDENKLSTLVTSLVLLSFDMDVASHHMYYMTSDYISENERKE